MKYYVVSDLHGFHKALIDALTEKGFFEDKEPHKLIICGDLFDRGEEAVELQEFISELINKDEVILIRGNHDDLFEELVNDIEIWMTYKVYQSHHWRNGTVSTLLQLTNMDLTQACVMSKKCAVRARNTPYMKKFMPLMRDYFETEHYIFVHGWIPSVEVSEEECYYDKNWREPNKDKWENARWINGIDAANKGVIELNKTIVCGHIATTYAHTVIERKVTDYIDFTPYYGKGIIAIDGSTSISGIVNCLVFED